MPLSESTREVDCPLCEGYGTLRDFLTTDGQPADCWLCEGWGKVAVPSGSYGRGELNRSQ